MVKLKEILGHREIEMLRHFHWMILNTDIEDFETIEMYKNEINERIYKAKQRYYEVNPSVVPIKSDAAKVKDSFNSKVLKVRDLFTIEEDEISFVGE